MQTSEMMVQMCLKEKKEACNRETVHKLAEWIFGVRHIQFEIYFNHM